MYSPFGHDHRGRAVHYIFSFPKEGKEKDAISIPHAIPFSERFLGNPQFLNMKDFTKGQKKTSQFLEKFCGPYEPVYEPFFTGFEKTFVQINMILLGSSTII